MELKSGDMFSGSTEDKNCLNSLRGAQYATSVVRIEEFKIESWDQGFDDNEIQVWGATKGPYIFEKLNNIK